MFAYKQRDIIILTKNIILKIASFNNKGMALVGILGSLEYTKYTKLYSLTTMNEEYKTYLLSDKWKQKRELVFQKKWRKCEKCKSENHLVIHHWTYIRIYKEKVSDLFVLCNWCHKELHEKYWTRDLMRSTKAFIEWEELIPRKKKIRKSLEERREARKIRKENQFQLAILDIQNDVPYMRDRIGSIKIWRRAKKYLELFDIIKTK